MSNISLRSATADDAQFAFDCETQTMRPYAMQTWGKWPEQEVKQRAYDNASAGMTQIVEYEGEPIGVLRVERNSMSYDLKQVFLLPAYQRRGIGSVLIKALMAEAGTSSVPLKLRVLNVNPARDLYKRLGFRVVESTEDHEYLEYA